ncbi:MAG: NADH-quinone oxidoreductase subunit N [Deltaproteobacteria bacterium]|nr:MAG: NADH-quinone oxidoreductase subunit N [Deltaproteobacteria bacterium]
MNAAPSLDFLGVAPMLVIALGSMVVLMLEVSLARAGSFLGRPATGVWRGTLLALVSVVFLGIVFGMSAHSFLAGSSHVFNLDHPMVRLDRFANFGIAVIAMASALVCLLSFAYLSELRIHHGEYYALILIATLGTMLLVAATDLLTIFLGIELMSIPIYVLAGFDRRKLQSNESALKYFMIGSFASAILLYGMALLYGATGKTELAAIRAAIEGGSATNPLLVAGMGLALVGFAFKVSSVPFHQWTPDVYEGAPTSVTAYMSVTVKTAAFVALLRFLIAFEPLQESLIAVLWWLSVLTMIVGNVMAVIQNNVKRLLAYSSIAHAGYLLLGLLVATPEGYSAVLFYLLVYAFMNVGAFGVVIALAQHGRDCDRISDFAGLAQTRPGLAALMTLFLLALTGIPGTAGFVAKFMVFAAAVKEGYVGITIIAVLTSLVSVYYYLRIPVVMYMREAGEEEPRAELSTGEMLVLAACGFAVLFLGLFPNAAPGPLSGFRALDWARQSVALFF